MKKNNKLEANFPEEEFEVIRKLEGDVTVKSLESGKEYRRNVAHLKRIGGKNKSKTVSQNETTREKRKRVKPAKSKISHHINCIKSKGNCKVLHPM